MSKSWIESELKAALEESYRPAPLLLSASIVAVRRTRRRRRPIAWVAGIAAALVAISLVVVFESIRQLESSNRIQAPSVNSSQLPKPIPQPITSTSPAAQVAWLWMQSQGQQPYLVAVDRGGHMVARLNESADAYGVWRSGDGAAIYAPGPAAITAYSALDGKVLRTYSWDTGIVVGDTFSTDGHWLAVLRLGFSISEDPPFGASPPLRLQVIDLHTGSSQELAITRDRNASLPGMSCNPNPNCSNSVVWGMVVFDPDSTHLYTLTDWGGPVRLSSFNLVGGKMVQTASAVDGEAGRRFSTCGAPAMAAKVIDGGRTLVAFCHMDGAVWFFDLATLTESSVIQSKQPNPFWLSPLFTPDGQLLYLHQWPAFGDRMQVIDLSKRKLLGPAATPTNTDQNGPFAWLMTNAYAGGIASTVPISPDGLKLYSATANGVMVLRIPDLKPIAKLASGFNTNEVWITGDGQTIYATSEDGMTLLVMRADGSNQRRVNLPDLASGFLASEHG